MQAKNPRNQHARPRTYMAAVVLGTALSAMGSAQAEAAPAHGPPRAVQDLSRYCTACWRNARLHPDSWTDCTQEVFSRLLERVAPDSWNQVLKEESEERREFLRAIDAVKKRTQRGRARWQASLPEAVPDRREARDRSLADERDLVQQAASQLLSPRQQRVLQLSFDGWTVQEIATELAVGPERVSDEKYKAIRKLRQHLTAE